MKVIKQTSLFLMLVLSASGAIAQAIPDTEIFLVTVKKQRNTFQIGAPANITQRPGYDNQPSFTPDGKSVLYTSQRDGKQTDIYQYHLQSKHTDQLTATPEAEYSPLVTPDGETFSVVRGKEQDLWRFPLKPGSGEPSLLMDMPQLIGYHVWYTKDTLLVAAFPDNPPMSMYVVAPGTNTTSKLEENIGRSLQNVPKKAMISYLVPLSDSVGDIKQIHLKTGKREKLIQSLPGSQDYVWTPDGHLLMAQGAKLFRYLPGTDQRWTEIADMSKYGIKTITRLAISPNGNQLAFVANW